MINIIQEISKDHGALLLGECKENQIVIKDDFEGTHKYLKILRISNLSQIKTILGATSFIESGDDVQICIYFFDDGRNLLEKQLLKANQLDTVICLDGVYEIELFVRLGRRGTSKIDKIIFSEHEELLNYISNNLSFKVAESALKFETKNDIPSNYCILMETLFCDTEVREPVLNRYFSYLKSQVILMSNLNAKSFFWAIHVSSDKKEIIKELNSLILNFKLSDTIFVNIYHHPSQGYGNDQETHIDRLIKPNATYGELRDKLSKNAMDKVVNLVPKTETFFIRCVLDDDDFLNPKVFNAVVREIERYDLKRGIIVNRKINIAYHNTSSKCIKLDRVKFSRVVSGCRFLVAQGEWPAHPFAINENIGDELMAAGQKYTVVDSSDAEGIAYSFIYNRHGINLSSNHKQHFYEELFKSEKFDKSEDLMDYFINLS